MTIAKKIFKCSPLGLLILCSACASLSSSPSQKQDFPAFSYEAHRGGRGLYPENSIGAMKMAIGLPKVTTLEMDCHISKDNKVVVFHDDYLNPKFIQYTDGKPLSGKDNKGTVYDYNYADLSRFDIGSKFYKDFPKQEKTPTAIPLLADLIDETEALAKKMRTAPMFYNIETKSTEGKDGIYHPDPRQFSDLLLQVVIDKGIAPRTVIQSFDKRTIQYIHRTYPQIKTSYLISGKNKKNVAQLVEELGYRPFIISPYYTLVTPTFVNDAHKAGIKVLPWTVNDKAEIEKLKKLGVDGIISDYPDLF